MTSFHYDFRHEVRGHANVRQQQQRLTESLGEWLNAYGVAPRGQSLNQKTSRHSPDENLESPGENLAMAALKVDAKTSQWTAKSRVNQVGAEP